MVNIVRVDRDSNLNTLLVAQCELSKVEEPGLVVTRVGCNRGLTDKTANAIILQDESTFINKFEHVMYNIT